jgi:hypothetical protein
MLRGNRGRSASASASAGGLQFFERRPDVGWNGPARKFDGQDGRRTFDERYDGDPQEVIILSLGIVHL